ncbi:MAG: DUF2750 domain-containing protein [Gammaproteobacteria bacterium]|nr:DUF2750 domain-containing protein [Gammaproteobacteria bacterium]
MSELSKDPEKNYEIFLADAINTGLVWALVTSDDEDAEFAMCESEEDPNRAVLVVFSSQTFASQTCTEDWNVYHPRAIELDDFIDNWLPGMQKDGLLVGVNWTVELIGEEVEPLDLSLDLLETD